MQFDFPILCAALLLATSATAQVQVESAWARPTVTGQSVGGGYLSLRSARADRLLGASTPGAERVELHTMAMAGDVMQMRQLDAIDLPAGQTVELRPGGQHLMLLGLKQPLAAGSKLPLTLRFEKAGEMKVDVMVTTAAPATPAAHEHKHKH